MPELTDLEAQLTRLAYLKQQIDELKPFSEEYRELKYHVMQQMIAQGSARTQDAAGVYVTLSKKVTPVVTDTEALHEWLLKNAYAPNTFMVDPALDMGKIEQIAKEVLQESGEVVPGLEWQESISPSVRAAK